MSRDPLTSWKWETPPTPCCKRDFRSSPALYVKLYYCSCVNLSVYIRGNKTVFGLIWSKWRRYINRVRWANSCLFLPVKPGVSAGASFRVAVSSGARPTAEVCTVPHQRITSTGISERIYHRTTIYIVPFQRTAPWWFKPITAKKNRPWTSTGIFFGGDRELLTLRLMMVRK